MAVKIEVAGYEATARVKNLIWTCEDKDLEWLLNRFRCQFETDHNGHYTPDMDYDFAEFIIEKFGGKILRYWPLKFDPNVVY